jgi:hypothetical protein
MPPLADGDNNNYDDGEEDDGEGETPVEHAMILLCVFQDFCCPPPSIGCALTVVCWCPKPFAGIEEHCRLVKGGASYQKVVKGKL